MGACVGSEYPDQSTIDEIVELNIGHSIIARAIMVGMTRAVAEMKQCIAAVRKDG